MKKLDCDAFKGGGGDDLVEVFGALTQTVENVHTHCKWT
jgi:hypothetical protein